MHKLPVYIKWHVQSVSNKIHPAGSRLNPQVLVVETMAQLAEDESMKSPVQHIHFKLGGEKEAGTVHVSGDMVDTIKRVNEWLLDEICRSQGLTRYEDLPEDVKDICLDPSIPLSDLPITEEQELPEADPSAWERLKSWVGLE